MRKVGWNLHCVWNKHQQRRPGQCKAKLRSVRAFTLLEVLLAVALTVVLMLMALTGYRQALAEKQMIQQEMVELREMRTVMERMTAMLRMTVEPGGGGAAIRGDARSLTVVGAVLPEVEAFAEASEVDEPVLTSGLVLRSFTLLVNQAEDQFEVVGLNYSQQSQSQRRVQVARERESSSLDASEGASDLSEEVAEQATEQRLSGAQAWLAESVKYVRFRYLSQRGWSEVWNEEEPPAAVEVSLGRHVVQFEDEQSAEEEVYPYPVMRRVIAIPAGLRHASVSGLAEEVMW